MHCISHIRLKNRVSFVVLYLLLFISAESIRLRGPLSVYTRDLSSCSRSKGSPKSGSASWYSTEEKNFRGRYLFNNKLHNILEMLGFTSLATNPFQSPH